MKLSFKSEEEIETFSDKKKNREFISSRLGSGRNVKRSFSGRKTQGIGQELRCTLHKR